MAEWVEFTETYVLAAMPSDVSLAYTAWIGAHPEKAERLEAIAGQVLADFRSGLSANPYIEIDEDEGKLLERCVPHALTTVIYHLMLEMGMSVNMSAQTAFNNAQVYLRRLYLSDEALDGGGGGTPAYKTGIEREERVLV
ncbi:MAG: hypothetical protein PHR35_11105 [Kiritimatiellae bacterium]|nr:hypothetical protein [Kiritimatiellia bacterium]